MVQNKLFKIKMPNSIIQYLKYKFFKNIYSKFLIDFFKYSSTDKWIFIVGCYNSGTTLLHNILSCHSKISSMPNEGVYYSNILDYPENYSWPRMYYKCIKQINKKNIKLTYSDAEKIKRQWDFWFNKKKKIKLEKSISNSTRIPFFYKFFKNAHFIYIVRNGYVVSKSIQNKSNLKKWKNYKYKKYPIELCAKQWVISDQINTKYLKNIKNKMLIQYEDLTQNTDKTLCSIFKFLKIKKKNLNELKNNKTFKYKVRKVNNLNNVSYNKLTQVEILKINKIASRVLKKYSYYTS